MGEIARRLREATARQASRFSTEPDTYTRWLRRARIVLYFLTTALLAWELYVSQADDLPTGLVAIQVLAILLLYGVGRWPVVVAGLSLPLLMADMVISSDPLSLTIIVALVITGVLVASHPRQFGYLYAGAMVVILTTIQPSGFLVGDLASWLLAFLIPCALGEAVRSMLRSVDRIRRASAAHLARQRRDLARELHDTSIHDITSMIMALERAKLTGIDDPRLLDEIDHAIATGRQSVVSMRGVLKILRAEDYERAVNGTHDVPAAIAAAAPTVRRALEDARASLQRVGHELQVYVEDQIDAPMSFSVRTALVRAIQECTANMAKYARPGSPCTVMIERIDTETRALFLNEAHDDDADDSALSSGLGLIGVRERVEAVGGQLAISHHDGRWIVQITIPSISSAREGQVARAAQH